MRPQPVHPSAGWERGGRTRRRGRAFRFGIFCLLPRLMVERVSMFKRGILETQRKIVEFDLAGHL